MNRKNPAPPLVIALTLAALALALAACGSGSDSSSSSSTAAASTTDTAASGGGSTISISADPSGALAFEQKTLSVKAGTDTIDFSNESSTPHNVVIEDAGGNPIAGTDTISGDSATATADLQPGTYTFFCDIPGHREAGMEGTLTVK